MSKREKTIAEYLRDLEGTIELLDNLKQLHIVTVVDADRITRQLNGVKYKIFTSLEL